MSFNEKILALDAEAIAEFGEALTYTPQGGSGIALNGVFDEAFHASQTLGEMGAIQSTSPGCVVNSANLPSGGSALGTEGDTITRGATVYFITGIEPSGGLVVLKLSLTNPT